MTRLLSSNGFFVISLLVIAGWSVVLFTPKARISYTDCPYRVSARGVVHGPDSPFWSLTAPHHCFGSRAAAVAFSEKVR